LNKFLHDVCKEKGIDFTDAQISDVAFLPNGDVSKLVDEAG